MEEKIKNDKSNVISSSNNDKKDNLNERDKKFNERNNLENNEKEVKIGNYLIKKTLGKGTFGKVKLGIYLPKNRKVAIKILEKIKLKEEDDIIRLKREFEMLSQFNHPNLITVSEIFETKDAYFTVMEFCEGGELFNYIVQNKYLSEEKSAFFYYQLINGLDYIHSLGIVHRDLKPENLLLTKDHILKIIDFGLSNYFKQTQKELLETPCGSPCYASPEMLSGKNYDGFKIDIWATGIILFAMLCGFLPFDHKDNDKLFLKILECKIQYPKTLSKDAEDLIKKTLVPDPEKRIDIPTIKKHPFYLKGKEIFETNFTIYQVSQGDLSDSDDISSFNYSLNNDFYFSESNHKSAKNINKYKSFYDVNIKNKKGRYNSCEINNCIKQEQGGFKKFINFEKKIYKMKKKNKKINYKNEINKLHFENNNKKNIVKNLYERGIKFNNSFVLQINNIDLFCENLINNYKKEEKKRTNRKQEPIMKISSCNNNNIIKYDNNKTVKNENRKEQLSKNKNNENENSSIKNNRMLITKDLIREKEKKIKNYNSINNRKDYHYDNSQFNDSQNKTTIVKNNLNNANNNKIKVNVKKKFPVNINKLFINNNKIKIKKKLPQNILKMKNYSRKIKSTSNDIKKKNIKKIIDTIKKQSLKNKTNIINKQYITHHHTTNITNMTQKNYISNVIINNYKRDESSSYKKSKIIPSPDNQKENNIINEYLQKLSEQNQPIKSNMKNWKFKINLQKFMLKDEMLPKKIVKYNSQSNNSKDVVNNEEKILSYLTVRDKKIKEKNKEYEISKTIPNNNDKKRRLFKTKVTNINTSNINNNIRYGSGKSNNIDNSLGLSLIGNNKLNLTNNSKIENKYFNNYFNINNTVESDQNKDNRICRKQNIEKLLNTNINFNLNLEKKLKRNEINNSLIDNTFSNRSFNYNMNKLFDKNNKKVNNSSKKNMKNNSGIKAIDNVKKKNLYDKNYMNYQKCKLHLKEIFGIENINKKDNSISLLINCHKQIQSQRNNPSSLLSKTYKNINIQNYLNTARNYDNKNSNISYNIDNIMNIDSKSRKAQLNQNNVNKDLIHINLNYNRFKKNSNSNLGNDNNKVKKNILKKKNTVCPKRTTNNIILNNMKYNYIPKKKSMNNRKRVNTKNCIDKYESKKMLSSLRKRINLKLNLINNNITNNINSNMNFISYIDNTIENKTHNNSMKIQEYEKGNNNSIITKINSKQFKINNNTIENVKTNNISNYNDFGNLKNKKEIKCNMNKKLKTKQKTNILQFSNLYLDNNNLNLKHNYNDLKMYICNTDGSSSNNCNITNNNNNYSVFDTKYNTINSSHHEHVHQFSNLPHLKKKNIIKKNRINGLSKLK